jgi:2-C-methyl-D-erythritol 2,4-cyclodiphosphate synthase
MFRIGIGYDLHKLEEGRKLVIGGVEIEHDKGFVAHSDGDILLHAITDALLGAVGISDIGEIFSNKDDRWKDADSTIFLKYAKQVVREEGYEIANIDSVIIIEKPKILPYRKRIIEKVADMLEVEENQVFVKAKTQEKMGFIGENKAAACYAVALIRKVY